MNAYPSEPKLDQSMRAALAFSSDVTASVSSDYLVPPILGFIPRLPTFSVRVYGDDGDVHLNNFISPSLYHSITVTKKNGDVKIVKAYSFIDSRLTLDLEDELLRADPELLRYW